MNKEKFKGILIGMVLVLVFSFTINTSLAETLQKNIRVVYSDIKLFVDGVKITPKDSKGEVVEPFMYNGTTYLPVRAISEALGKQVNWDQDTKSVYIGEMPKVTYSSCGPEEFLERHKPYKGSEFSVYGAGTVQIRQEDYHYFNRVSGGNGTYLVNGSYTKIKGLFIMGDKLEGARSRFIKVYGDGVLLFDGVEYLKSLGFKDGFIDSDSKDQPVPFEIDITGVEELTMEVNGYSSIFNVEFIGFDN